MSNSNTENTIQSAINAGRNEKISVSEYAGMPVAIMPNDWELKLVPELLETPLRINQTVTHSTALSFIDYYTTHHNPECSAIFIDDKTQSFTAILDYHDRNNAAGWKAHQSIFTAVKTDEAKTWLDNDKKIMTQEAFGQFIESNALEIIEPAAADMLEIALSIQATNTYNFSKAIRLDNGQTQLNYHEQINGTAGIGGQLKIPEKFKIGLKLFKGCDPYAIEARLRYRIKETQLVLWYELIRPQSVIDANLDDITQQIKDALPSNTLIYSAIPS